MTQVDQRRFVYPLHAVRQRAHFRVQTSTHALARALLDAESALLHVKRLEDQQMACAHVSTPVEGTLVDTTRMLAAVGHWRMLTQRIHLARQHLDSCLEARARLEGALHRHQMEAQMLDAHRQDALMGFASSEALREERLLEQEWRARSSLAAIGCGEYVVENR